MTDTDNSNGKFLAGLFVGGLIGAGIIAVLGTKEGKKTAKLLEEKGKDALELLQDKLEEIEKKGKELVKEGQALEQQMIEKLGDEKEVIVEKVAERLDDTLAHIEAIQERGRETTANIRKRFFKNLPKRSAS